MELHRNRLPVNKTKNSVKNIEQLTAVSHLVEALAASLSVGSWSRESTSEWTSSVESLWWGSSVGGWSTKSTTESELWGSKGCSDDSEENNKEFHDFWLKENFWLIKTPNLHRFLYLSTLKLCEEKTREKHFMPLVHLVMLRRRKTLIFLVEREVVDSNSQKRGNSWGNLSWCWRWYYDVLGDFRTECWWESLKEFQLDWKYISTK
jgi:hypothetical protein